MRQLTLAGGVLITAAIVAMGQAQADSLTDQFLADAHAQGYIHASGDAGLIGMGLVVCQELDVGWTPYQATLNVANANPMMQNPSVFVAIAATDLCPFHRNQGFNEGRPHFVG